MLVNDYLAQIEQAIAQRADVILRQSVYVEARTSTVGLMRGSLVFEDGSELHLTEYIDTEQGLRRLRYHYHYQDAGGRLVFRYDDKPHHPEVETFPHHKHAATGGTVANSSAPTLAAVLDEAIAVLAARNQ